MLLIFSPEDKVLIDWEIRFNSLIGLDAETLR